MEFYSPISQIQKNMDDILELKGVVKTWKTIQGEQGLQALAYNDIVNIPTAPIVGLGLLLPKASFNRVPTDTDKAIYLNINALDDDGVYYCFCFIADVGDVDVSLVVFKVNSIGGEKGLDGNDGLDYLLQKGFLTFNHPPVSGSFISDYLSNFNRRPVIGETFTCLYRDSSTNYVYLCPGSKVANIDSSFVDFNLGNPTKVSGDKGDAGTPGKDGVDGKDGADGAPGKDGKDGTNGTPGKDGSPGTPGKDGADGAPGLNAIYFKRIYDATEDPTPTTSIGVSTSFYLTSTPYIGLPLVIYWRNTVTGTVFICPEAIVTNVGLDLTTISMQTVLQSQQLNFMTPVSNDLYQFKFEILDNENTGIKFYILATMKDSGNYNSFRTVRDVISFLSSVPGSRKEEYYYGVGFETKDPSIKVISMTLLTSSASQPYGSFSVVIGNEANSKTLQFETESLNCYESSIVEPTDFGDDNLMIYTADATIYTGNPPKDPVTVVKLFGVQFIYTTVPILNSLEVRQALSYMFTTYGAAGVIPCRGLVTYWPTTTTSVQCPLVSLKFLNSAYSLEVTFLYQGNEITRQIGALTTPVGYLSGIKMYNQPTTIMGLFNE